MFAVITARAQPLKFAEIGEVLHSLKFTAIVSPLKITNPAADVRSRRSHRWTCPANQVRCLCRRNGSASTVRSQLLASQVVEVRSHRFTGPARAVCSHRCTFRSIPAQPLPRRRSRSRSHTSANWSSRSRLQHYCTGPARVVRSYPHTCRFSG